MKLYIGYLRTYYPIGGDTIIFSQSVLLDTINNKWINANMDLLKDFTSRFKSIMNIKLLGYEGGNLFKKEFFMV